MKVLRWLLLLFVVSSCPLSAQDTVFTRTIVPRAKPPTVVCAPDALQRARLDSLMAELRQAGSDRTVRRITAAAAILAAVGVVILVFRGSKEQPWPTEKPDDADH